MEFGSLADWVGGIGGFLAALAAVVAWRENKRLVAVERARDGVAERERDKKDRIARRAQASVVFAMGAKLTRRSDEETWAIYLYNGSSRPVYNIKVQSHRLGGGKENYPLSLAALPPGQFVVPSHPQYHWGAMFDLSLHPEPVELLVKRKAKDSETRNPMIVNFSFEDSEGRSWNLDRHTILTEG